MAMPVVIEVVDKNIKEDIFDKVFEYLEYIDNKFSTYKKDSEIEKINRGDIEPSLYSSDMKKILDLCEQTKKETYGYFDISHKDKLDPSGIVKGFAIHESGNILKSNGYRNFYINIAGDIEVMGKNSENKDWIIGIENPFLRGDVIKRVKLTDKGIATSGDYIRGDHIWNKDRNSDIVSVTVIGENAYEADRFATAAFAMGKIGIDFIENLLGFEGYMIDKFKNAVFTSQFENFVI